MKRTTVSLVRSDPDQTCQAASNPSPELAPVMRIEECGISDQQWQDEGKKVNSV